MEKRTPRTRRSGSDTEQDQMDGTPMSDGDMRHTGSLTATSDAPASASPGQAAKERLRNSADAAPPGTPKGPPALKDAFVDERNDVLAVINELEDQLDRHQDIREALERELASSADKLQQSNARAQELEWQVVTLQTRVEALEQARQQAAALEEELSDAVARNHRLKDQVVATEKERAQLRNDLKGVNKQLDELFAVRKERDGLRTDCKDLSARVEELERSQREMFEERGQLQSALQEVRADLAENNSERNQLQAALRASEDRTRELIRIQETLTDKIDALRGDKKSLQAQFTHLERENARLIEQRQFYECEVTSLRNQLRTAEGALASVKKAFGEVRVALTETKTRARRRTVDTWPSIGSTFREVSVDASEQILASGEADVDDVTPQGHTLDIPNATGRTAPTPGATATPDSTVTTEETPAGTE